MFKKHTYARLKLSKDEIFILTVGPNKPAKSTDCPQNVWIKDYGRPSIVCLFPGQIHYRRSKDGFEGVCSFHDIEEI